MERRKEKRRNRWKKSEESEKRKKDVSLLKRMWYFLFLGGERGMEKKNRNRVVELLHTKAIEQPMY